MSVTTETAYRVILFKTVSAAMKAEKLLKSAGVPHRLVPVPKKISADCGICLRYELQHEDRVLHLIKDKVDYTEIRDI